jgi:hypothetical protein
MRMLFHESFLLLFNSRFLFLNFSLLLNNPKEFVPFLFSLLCQSPLSVQKLLLPGFFQIFQHFLFVLQLSLFLSPSQSFTLLKGSLCSQSINFRLAILGFLLHLSQSLHLSFFLFLDSLLLPEQFFLPQCLVLIILHNLLLQILLLLFLVVFYYDLLPIGILYLLHHNLGTISLQLSQFHLVLF